MILAREHIDVVGHVTESHGIKAKPVTYEQVKENYRKNDLNCCDLEAAETMIADLMQVREDGDTAGGFLGGISTGEDLVMKLTVKATPTISKPQDSVDMINDKEGTLAAITRRDISLLPRVYPVAEAMVRLAIWDALYMAKGYDHFARLDPKWKRMGEPRHKGQV